MACAEFIGLQVSRNWTLVSTLCEDRGFSGSHPRRQGFQSLLAGLKRGLIDVVVVHRLDRLTRNLSDFQQIIAEFNAHNVASVSVTQRLPLCFRSWVASCGQVSNQYPDFFCGIRTRDGWPVCDGEMRREFSAIQRRMRVKVRDYKGCGIRKPLATQGFWWGVEAMKKGQPRVVGLCKMVVL